MRAGVWCGAAALALLTLVSALRTSQVEGASRVSRRLPAPSEPEAALENTDVEDVTTFKSRTSKKRQEILARGDQRVRTRSRPTAVADEETSNLNSETPRNERFDSTRTYSRTRSRLTDTASSPPPTGRENVIRSRTRQSSRERQRPQPTPSEAPSPKIEDTKPESYYPTTYKPKVAAYKVTTPRTDDTTTQYRRRSSTSPTSETLTTRRRGRINTRVDTRALDLAVSGTTNTITVTNKEPTTARTAEDLRNSRKLRYRTRFSETDSNLTGEGITATNKVSKSSQTKENFTSQPEIQTSTPATETTAQPSSETTPVQSTSSKPTKVVRRPLTRGKGHFGPAISQKKKHSDEISEDDNYPESFKALLHAKNASTQTSSPTRESLSVKASQKVYKTYTSSPQSTNTGPAQSKYARFRSKISAINEPKMEESKTETNEENPVETTVSSEQNKPKAPEFRLRSAYNPRNRKTSNFSTVTPSVAASISSERSSDKPLFKYNRKFKPSTTEAPKIESTSKFKRLGTNALLKKSLVRPAYNGRRNSGKNLDLSSEGLVSTERDNMKNDSSVTYIKTLPRTSYYSRFRNKNNDSVTTASTETYTESIVETPAVKKMENTADMPLIFSLLKNSAESETTNAANKEQSSSTNEPEKERKMFIIAVTSKESSENSTENEVPNKTEEIEEKMFVKAVSPAQKYHANYKDMESDVSEKKDQDVNQSTPRSRNYPSTRRSGRKRTKPEHDDEVPEVTSKTRHRNSQRKYSEAFSKSTEPSTNGIPPEPEKQKSRYSAKYRTSYLDKPYYKPTIPTVTPSTAWLKFFVTDPQLAKSVEEPYWFGGDDIFLTTEISSHNSTTSPSSHESSLELVEGEEMQLGPDMNAISFTKTRSTLSSADLRLSESHDKSSHIMNVEALQHSASVTVSIFDALAEILTSTPRTPRLSSTTDVMQKQNINDITLNGVSNSITVNSIGGLASPDTSTMIADANSVTKFVQTTAQTTPTVNNSQPVEETVTPSLNTQDGNVSPVNTPTTPTPFPTTPVSARRPFAFKILYRETDPPTDKMTTTESIHTSIQPSTDIPETVHNTVSDFLLTNNHLVSSELTSMLSNNIKNIMQNMNEETRSKISVDMAKLLKTLIPRALDGLPTGNDNVDIVPDTTPYSLEELRDTENISIDDKNANSNFDKNDISFSESLQSVVTDNIVNSKPTSIGTTLGVTETPTLVVNSDETPSITNLSTSGSQMTSAVATLTTESITTVQSSTTSTITSNTTPTLSTATPSVSFDTESINIDGNGNRVGNEDTNMNAPPFPFLTNFKVRDFTALDMSDLDTGTPTTKVPIYSTQPDTLTKSFTLAQTNDIKRNAQEQNTSQVSPLQLWVLNKKARVLQMIEDLIRNHNTEIQTVPPMTEFLSQPNNIPLSNRLTEILNTMSSTTEATTTTVTESDTFVITTQSLSSFPLLSTQSTLPDNSENSENGQTVFPPLSGDAMSTTTQAASDIFSRLSFTNSDASGTQSSTENSDGTASTAAVITTTQDTAEISNADQTTTPANIETTTAFINTETIQTDTEFKTTINLDMITEANLATTTNPPVTERKQNFASVVSNQVNISNESPKKDYVIFGILPNNTVVRKDPNEDILETLTEASPYIIYSLLPNNTVIRRFPNGTRVPRVMQKIDVLPISPWTLRNPYSPIHNNPAIVRPHNPIRVSTNIVTSTDTSNNGTENRLTIDTVNNQQTMIPTTLNIKDSSSLGVTTAKIKLPAEKSTASHVLSLRTSTMLPSVDEILLNSISSAVKEEMVISSMMSSTREPTILTLDIDPETGQIRTEKPGDGSERTVFKYIPINEVTVASQGTNVLKLASTKAPSTPTMGSTESIATVTEIITQTPQIQTRQQISDPTTTEQMTAGTPIEMTTVYTNAPLTTEGITSPLTTVVLTTTEGTTTTEATVTTLAPTTTTRQATTMKATTSSVPTVTEPLTTIQTTTFITTASQTITSDEKDRRFNDANEFRNISPTERSAKSLDVFSTNNQIPSTDFTTTAIPITSAQSETTQPSEETKLLQAILAAQSPNPSTVSISNLGGNLRVNTGAQTSTTRSIEDDIRQFEEDTKLLKALLAATGQNPANLNIPSLESLNIPTRATTPLTRATTTVPTTTTPTTTTTLRTTPRTTTTFRAPTTTQSINDDLRKLTEDAKLLQALLQATGQSNNNAKPIISGVTSNVRIASDPKTTTVVSNPTTPVNVRPVFTSRTTTQPAPFLSTLSPVSTTLQPSTTAEESGVSTTIQTNFRRRMPTTTVATARRVPSPRLLVTTEIPSTSTFSVEEDLQFLQNLKSVLNNNPNPEDPEAGLANRIIALAVERSLNEIESGKQANDGKTGKTVVTTPINKPITTSTTTTTTTTTARTTTVKDNTPSLEDDIKQFQEDTKLLQALLKATGQDPSTFNIPTLPPIVTSDTRVSPQLPTRANDDLKLLSNLLASPSPLNEPFDSLTEKSTAPTMPRPFGAKIAVKDNLKTEKDDVKLLQTLVKLQGVTETTTQKAKLAITGQSSEEALKKLVQQTKTPGMMSDATKAPASISTEYGKSNDALLAALLKEQGFGPTTASSLDEQLRLAALLNQVVVTPKARRTTTTPPPPPPPPPRRPVLDGLAWLWQQWRDTDPGRPAARPNRRPLIPSSAPPSAASSNRVPWFGSGPFVGNADEQPSSNRVPLEPPRVVTSEQAPGRGQLVSAAINVTRAFSQFLGAAIAGAAQTVQSVIRAGQRATADAYTTGSG